MPKRIQRKRTRDWKMPPGAVYVGRPTDKGNPYKIGAEYKNPFTGGTFTVTPENCLELFETYAKGRLAADPNWLKPLRGKDLACWCRPDAPCHADILLKLANKPPSCFICGGDKSLPIIDEDFNLRGEAPCPNCLPGARQVDYTFPYFH